jgi:hypothetical protein
MSATQKDSGFNPFSALKPFQDAWMDSWAKALINLVNNEAFANMMGQVMGQNLQASEPFRRQMAKLTEGHLQQLNLATGGELRSLGERLTKLELRADDLDAKLDEILGLLRGMKEVAR